MNLIVRCQQHRFAWQLTITMILQLPVFLSPFRSTCLELLCESWLMLFYFLLLSYSATVGPMPKHKQSAVADSNNATSPHRPTLFANCTKHQVLQLVIQEHQAPEGPRHQCFPLNTLHATRHMTFITKGLLLLQMKRSIWDSCLGGWLSWMRQNVL